jgi:hypothetical protein
LTKATVEGIEVTAKLGWNEFTLSATDPGLKRYLWLVKTTANAQT